METPVRQNHTSKVPSQGRPLAQYDCAADAPGVFKDKSRDELIEEYIPKVRFIACTISSRLGAQVEFEEIMHAGLVGLLDAIDKYDPSRNNKFTTYAEFRIRGAILDSLRGLDLLSRTARSKAKKLKKTIARLEKRLGREAGSAEVAREMGLSLDQYYSLLDEVKAVTICSIDASPEDDEGGRRSLLDSIADKDAGDPDKLLCEADFREALKRSILSMPDRHRKIIMLYYYKEMNFKEIGAVLGLSESRISQLHAEAIIRLRNRVDRLLSASVRA